MLKGSISLKSGEGRPELLVLGACNEGQKISADFKECLSCAAGKYSDGKNNKCTLCPVNHYCPKSSVSSRNKTVKNSCGGKESNPGAKTLSECKHVDGCTDPLANNTNKAATRHDQSACTYDLEQAGCRDDPKAINYNPNFREHDVQKCLYSDQSFGCMNDQAGNYDSDATVDDGSCDLRVHGCTNEHADNYDSDATVDDGTCFFSEQNLIGCMNPESNNYDAKFKKHEPSKCLTWTDESGNTLSPRLYGWKSK